MHQQQQWKLEGDYFEGCNCNSICPCIFMGNPTEENCKVALGWHIQKGYYNDINLDELNAAAVFVTPGNMFTGPKWKAALYIDERAKPEQREALINIFSGKAGGFFGIAAKHIAELMGVRYIPIEFNANGKRRSMRIQDALELDVEGIEGADPNKESLVVNPKFTVAAPFDPIVARSTKNIYHDHGQEWDNSGKNAFYGRFAYSP